MKLATDQVHSNSTFTPVTKLQVYGISSGSGFIIVNSVGTSGSKLTENNLVEQTSNPVDVLIISQASSTRQTSNE